jgi:predicted MFS family arabinose efflux permease
VSRRALFASLCSLVFMVNLGRVVFAPLLEPLRVAFDASGATLGLVATLAWLGSAAPRVPTGYLLTKVPRHLVVLGTGAVLTGAAVFTALAPSVEVLLLGAFLMGLASGAYFIAANPLVSELFPGTVGRALGIHGTASQIAAVVAPTLVTLALVVGTWRTTFLWMAGAAAVATVAFTIVARRSDLPEAGTADRDFLGAARAQWRVILAGVAIIGATGFVWNGLFNFYVTYLTTAKALSEASARTVLTVVFAAGVPAFFVTGDLADRVPLVPLILTILGGFAGCLLLLTVTTGFWPLVAMSAVTGYVVHSLFPALDTYLLGSLPDRHRASAYAVYSGSMMVVQATGSLAVGALYDAGFGFDAVFQGLAVGLVAVLVGLVALDRLDRLPSGARA